MFGLLGKRNSAGGFLPGPPPSRNSPTAAKPTDKKSEQFSDRGQHISDVERRQRLSSTPTPPHPTPTPHVHSHRSPGHTRHSTRPPGMHQRHDRSTPRRAEMIISSMVGRSCPCPQILDIQAMVEVRSVLDPPQHTRDLEGQRFRHSISIHLAIIYGPQTRCRTLSWVLGHMSEPNRPFRPKDGSLPAPPPCHWCSKLLHTLPTGNLLH